MMHFINEEHEHLFFECLETDQTDAGDQERLSFFYLISSMADGRSKIGSIYDFNDKALKRAAIDEMDLSSGSLAMLKMAMHLYNGHNKDYKISILDALSNLDEDHIKVAFQAIKIRLGIGAIDDYDAV